MIRSHHDVRHHAPPQSCIPPQNGEARLILQLVACLFSFDLLKRPHILHLFVPRVIFRVRGHTALASVQFVSRVGSSGVFADGRVEPEKVFLLPPFASSAQDSVDVSHGFLSLRIADKILHGARASSCLPLEQREFVASFVSRQRRKCVRSHPCHVRQP